MATMQENLKIAFAGESKAIQKYLAFALAVAMIGSVVPSQGMAESPSVPSPRGALVVTDYFPPEYVADGSVSYQGAIQTAILAASEARKTLVFPPQIYLLDNERGLVVPSRSVLYMYGAVFRFDGKRTQDGQAFLGENVTDVSFFGGEVEGQRDKWPDHANIAGVRITGRSARIRIRDIYLHDLSSTGIGIFGENEEHMIEDVWLNNVTIRRCCNKYIDYLQPGRGPVKGSDRKDQGGVAFYFVRNFVVDGCSLEDSRSDGTHFDRCREGRFVNNRVIGSKMGGYFLETCHHVLAANNLIRGNGSRGVTIEAGSRYCTLQGNVIEESGREGLWAADSIGLVVTGNVFRRNGRKDHGDLDGEIMINESGWDPSKTPRAENYRISDNIFYATAEQGAVIRVLPKVADIIIENNTLRGPCRKIFVDWASPDVQHIVVRHNDGWKTENSGLAVFDGDGSTTVFRFPHGLDFAAPDESNWSDLLDVLGHVVPASAAAAGRSFVASDSRHVVVTFLSPPPKGVGNVKLQWTVQAQLTKTNPKAK